MANKNLYTPLTETQLDEMFVDAKSNPVLPDVGFMERLELQAVSAQPRQAVTPKDSFWATIGGWTTGAGFAVAAMVGVAVGISGPDMVQLLDPSMIAEANLEDDLTWLEDFNTPDWESF